MATKTVVATTVDDAASMAAGYVARQIFARDPATPLWCYGAADGRDLGALLLAQLEDLDRRYLTALRLHALNREQYPRFFRGIYRMCMSLEMIADPEFRFLNPAAASPSCWWPSSSGSMSARWRSGRTTPPCRAAPARQCG